MLASSDAQRGRFCCKPLTIVGMNDMASQGFVTNEVSVCTSIGDAVGSAVSCMVEDFNCDSLFLVEGYIVVDAAVNYADRSDVASGIREDIAAIG